MTIRPKENISKLDAAKRQLETAIALWFDDGDAVSTHALAYAAYEIIHTISKKRDPNRAALLFDTPVIKDEYRKDFAIWLKRHANFFKHGDRDGEAIIEFHPILTELYIQFALLGLELLGEPKSATASAYLWWGYIHRPNWLTESGRKVVSDTSPPEGIEHLRRISKGDFLKAFQHARRLAARN